PNGFFRHFAGSPGTQLRVDAELDHQSGRVTLRIADGGDHRHRGRRIALQIADAYGPDRRIELSGAEEISVDTGRSGGWYDLAVPTPADPSFASQLAGRLESPRQLTSDPQLGRTPAS